MIVDPAVVPGFLLLLAELVVLAGVGFIVARVALRQTDDRLALAQGLVVGPVLWGLVTSLVFYAVPGLAGAAVGWGVTLSLGAILAWRATERIRPETRTAGGFAVAVLVLLWVGLASRQLLEIPDEEIHLGLSAALRAGGFPPELPWSPGVLVRYHHGVDLMIGLLAPPIGPDLAFTTELVGVYTWTSFVLVVVMALVRRGSWRIALLLSPLLIATGLWTWQTWSPGILQGPFPAGLPAAGLRASLADLYWPTVGEVFLWGEAALPDIWKPSYTLAYALAMVVLERVAQGASRSWPATLTLAGLVGFMGLLSTTLTPVVLGLWAGLEALPLIGQVRRARSVTWRAVARPGAGLALTALLLMAGGGRFTGVLEGSASSGLAFWWEGIPESWQLLGVFDSRPGGVALLAVGPVVVAGLAALLARRDRLVLALAVGAGLLAVAWLILRYEPYPKDLNRLAGHARNFALVALLMATSARFAELRPRWRLGAGFLLIGLVVWPTSIGPVRNLWLAINQGVEVANVAPRPPFVEAPLWGQGRYALPAVSARVSAYLRNHTAVNARVLAPELPNLAVTYATGRPSSLGYANMLHLIPYFGPEYLDVRDHLDPGAARRLGIDYIYATDDWVAGLPSRARHWLADPELFELVVRDGDVALYRVRPAFLALAASPTPESFEALRQAIPSGTTLYWPGGAVFETDTTMRVASALLPEAKLFGEVKHMRRKIYALTPMPTERLGEQTPDLVMLPQSQEPWMFPPEGRQPIWWNHETAIYAPHGAVAPVMPPPNAEPSEPPPMSVRVTDVRVEDGRAVFTMTADDHSPDRWTGQDWVLISVDESPWAIPRHLDGGEPVVEQWFAGQVIRGRGTTTHGYRFDAAASSLALRTGDGGFRTEESSDGAVGPGTWTLVLRLLREEDRGTFLAHEEAAFIPVLKFTVSPAGEVAYEVYDDVRAP